LAAREALAEREVEQLAESSRKQMNFKSGFESRERESQFNIASGSEFQLPSVSVYVVA